MSADELNERLLTPRELWTQAHADPDWYRQLMAWHGYTPEPDVPDTWPRR